MWLDWKLLKIVEDTSEEQFDMRNLNNSSTFEIFKMEGTILLSTLLSSGKKFQLLESQLFLVINPFPASS